MRRAASGAGEFGHEPSVVGGVARRQEQVERPADHFRGRVAEYFFRPVIEQHHSARRVRRNDTVLGDG